MRHCVLVGPLPPPEAGQSVCFRMLVEAVTNRGIDHSVVDIGGGEVTRRDGALSWGRLKGLLRPFARALGFLLRPRSILYLTIAQSKWGFLRDLVFVTYARVAGYRIVLHLHGGNFDHFYHTQGRRMQGLIQSMLLGADRIIVLGESLRAMFDFLPPLANRITVVSNGLPEPLPGDTSPCACRHPADQPFRLLYLSNLIESKGYLDLLEAVRRLREERGRDVELDLCGAFLLESERGLYRSVQDAEADFHRRVDRAGLSEAVTYHGVVTGQGKHRMLEQAHALVLPTRYNNEGQPVCIIEAMARGVVPLSTKYRAIPDMIADEDAGLYIEAGNPVSIADRVEELLDNPDRYEELSASAIARCRERFAPEVHLDRLIGVILGEGVSCVE